MWRAGNPIDANLTAANIKTGVSIFGVTGTFEWFTGEINACYAPVVAGIGNATGSNWSSAWWDIIFYDTGSVYQMRVYTRISAFNDASWVDNKWWFTYWEVNKTTWLVTLYAAVQTSYSSTWTTLTLKQDWTDYYCTSSWWPIAKRTGSVLSIEASSSWTSQTIETTVSINWLTYEWGSVYSAYDAETSPDDYVAAAAFTTLSIS